MRKQIKQISAITLAALSLGLTACMQDKKIVSAEISKPYTRTIQQSNEKISKDFALALSDFSFRLFQGTKNTQGENQLISPLSAYICLSLIANGASDKTQAQFNTALGMPTQERNAALSSFVSSLPSTKDARVEIANSIWLKENAITVKESFLQTNANYFSAQVYSSPFDPTTVQDINNWCYNHTSGKIDKLLDDIPSDTLAYLINTLDFDCKWENSYEKQDIHKEIFYNQDGSESEKTFLSSRETTYLHNETAIGFSRPYKGETYSFVALLPNENVSANELVNSLTSETWQKLWENREHANVQVQIPEFDYAGELDLKKTLQSFGITDAFNPMLANFKNMSEQPLYLSAIKQKVKIQVDRNGTKAAAVTWGEMKTTSMPIDEIIIILNNPFVYAIVDNATGIPLFLGKVNQL